MKHYRMKVIGMLLSLVLITICFSGCISPSEFVLSPEGPTKNPSDPTIGVDLNNNVHIVWMWMADSSIWYTKINPDGKTLVYNKMLFTSSADLGYPRIMIDSAGNINLFLLSRGGIHYTKIDNNGNVLINNSFVAFQPTYSKDFGSSSNVWDVLIDKNDNIHMLWLEENSTGNYSCRYIKMNTYGKIVVNVSVENFFGDEPITLCSGTLTIYHFYLSSAIDSKNVLHILWNKGYNTLNSTNYTSGNVNKTLYGDVIKVDSRDNLYIHSSNNHTKIDRNGTVLVSDSLSNVSVIQGYPVVIGDDGNYIYLGENGYVDSNNNVHIVSEEVKEKIWEQGRHYEPFWFYTIYYSKIDSNGTILVDEMVIDTDGEPSWENPSSPISALLCGVVVCLIVVAVIVVGWFLLRKSGRKGIVRK